MTDIEIWELADDGRFIRVQAYYEPLPGTPDYFLPTTDRLIRRPGYARSHARPRRSTIRAFRATRPDRPAHVPVLRPMR